MGDHIALFVGTGETPLPTVNKLIGKHWSHYNRIRAEWQAAALDALIERRATRRRFDRVRFEFTPVYPSGYAKQLPDTGATFAITKPVVDGIVAAGLIPDDNGHHVYGELHRPPRIDRVKQWPLAYPVLHVLIQEVEPDPHDCRCREIYEAKQLGASRS